MKKISYFINLLVFASLFSCQLEKGKSKGEGATDNRNITNVISKNDQRSIQLMEIDQKGNWNKQFPSNNNFVDTNISFNEIHFSKLDIYGNDEPYSIRLSNCKGWDNEPGDFRKIEIEIKEKKFFLENFDSWIKIPEKYRSNIDSEYFMTIDIGFKKPVLLFFGYGYASEPGFISVISFDTGKPTLIFNEQFEIEDIVCNDVGEYTIYGLYRNNSFCLSSNSGELTFSEVLN